VRPFFYASIFALPHCVPFPFDCILPSTFPISRAPLKPKTHGISNTKTARQMKRILLLLLSFLLLSSSAQDLSKLSKNKAFALSGNLSFNANFFGVQGQQSSQTPFFWSISGSPSISLFGLRFPAHISFRDSKLESNLQFPFNRFAASPSWKWVKVHLGQRSPRLSPYTLTGNDFNGVGIELTPGKLRFAFMRGTFRNLSTRADSLQVISTILPSYRRRGLAGKIGFGSRQRYVDLIWMKVRDELDDFTNLSDEFNKPLIVPEDNLVLGLDMQIPLLKALTIKVNGAGSLHTPNINLSPIPLDEWLSPEQQTSVSRIIALNASTRWGFAGDAELRLRLKPGSFSIKYHRVEPNFRSLGTFFVRQDVESWTANLQLRAFKNKLSLMLRGGWEQNNLSDLLATRRQRLIGMANLLIMPARDLQIQLNISNFQMDNRPGLITVEDSFRFVNVTQIQRASVRKSIDLGGPSLSLQGTINHQSVDEPQAQNASFTGIELWNAAFGTDWKNASGNFILGTNLNYQQSLRGDEMSTTWGVMLRINQNLWDKKLRLRLSSIFNQVNSQQATPRLSMTLRSSMRWQLAQAHSFNLGASLLDRNLQASQPIRSLRASVGYSFRF